MTLAEARASVVAAATSGRPSDDFPFPMGLVDFVIFSVAGKMMKEQTVRLRTGFALIEPWMLTELNCLTATKDDPECFSRGICETRFYVDLPAKPANVSDANAIQSVSIANTGIRFDYIPRQLVSNPGLMEFPPSSDHPAYTISGTTLWLFAGSRNLEKCKVEVVYVVGEAIKGELKCEILPEETSLAVPDGMEHTLVQQAAKHLLQAMSKPADLIDDGNAN